MKTEGFRGNYSCFLREGKSDLASRKQNSLDERFGKLRDIASLIEAKTAVIDGEVVALDQDGLPRFDALRPGHRNLAAR
jgi:ATP-dependent DNA ligase